MELNDDLFRQYELRRVCNGQAEARKVHLFKRPPGPQNSGPASRSSPVSASWSVEHRPWWFHVKTNKAIKEKRLLGESDTVARPRDLKWAYTIERLKERFRITGNSESSAS